MSLSLLPTSLAPAAPSKATFRPAAGSERFGAQSWLCTMLLPAAAVLELQSSAMALWSDNRAECFFNCATAELLAFGAADPKVNRELWLAHVHADDRERVIRSWQSLEAGEPNNVYQYRFLPLDGSPALQLEETAMRLSVDGPEKFVVICRYEAIGRQPCTRCGRASRAEVAKLVHQIGNSLQAVRGEVELLRLFGELPQRSFETINQGIDRIHQLVAQIDVIAELDGNGTAPEQRAPAAEDGNPECAGNPPDN